MKVTVQGLGDVSLSSKEFVAAGGEGQIFARGNTAYKVYLDPARMLPTGKMTELSAITDPDVIKPDSVLLDPAKHTPVGYTMRFVTDTMPLCQTFTRAFREREGLGHPQMLTLIQQLQQIVQHVHQAGILIVDLNEMNFLVDRAFGHVYAIDVDSYQTRHYPATAIMPSVKDWKVAGRDFTEGSDWFSFACVAYQMFTGIHPYKGKHATIVGMEERMKASISVLDPSVSVPKMVYPQDVIPPGYRAWFRAVLQDGKRLPPPADPGTFVVATVVSRIAGATSTLDIAVVFTLPEAIRGFWENAGVVLVDMARRGIYRDMQPVRGPTQVRAVGWSPKGNHAIVASVEKGVLQLFDATACAEVALPMRADAVMNAGGRIYVKSGERVLELMLTDMGSAVVASPRVAVNVLEHATQLHEGIVIQNLLGSTFVSVFPRAGAACQIRIPQLDAYRIVEARCMGRVIMVIGEQRGVYDRLTFVVDEAWGGAVLRNIVSDVTPSGLNFVVLDSGTCAHLNEEEDLEIWNVGAPMKVRVVDAKALGNDVRLVVTGGRVGAVRDGVVYSVRLK